MYLNGILIDTIQYVINTTNTQLIFGTRPTEKSFHNYNGKLDDIGIWNRALTCQEVWQLYSGTAYIAPTVSPISGLDQVAVDSSISLSNATGGGVWSSSNTGIATVNSSGQLTGVAPGTVNIIYTVSDGCTSVADTQAVNVLSYIPQNNFITGNDTICAGDTALLTANLSAPINFCSAPSGSLSTGLVGYWPFCGNANDVSGNGNNGELNGATLATDRFGNARNAYSFDGVYDWIQTLPNSQFTVNNLTLNVWVSVAVNNSAQFIVNGNNSSAAWAISCNNLGFNSFVNRGCSVFIQNNFGQVPSLNSWQNLVYVFTPTSVSLSSSSWKEGRMPIKQSFFRQRIEAVLGGIQQHFNHTVHISFRHRHTGIGYA